MHNEELVSKMMLSGGVLSLTLGIIVLVAGLITGVLGIVNGAKLIKHHQDMMF